MSGIEIISLQRFAFNSKLPNKQALPGVHPLNECITIYHVIFHIQKFNTTSMHVRVGSNPI